MAGSSRTLTGRPCGFCPLILLAGLLGAPGGSVRAAQGSADVLVVEHPGRLVLFSKYQQRLTPDESRRLPPFVPMVLVQERDHLGDGFTPCASVEIDREPYYILRDEGGGLSSEGDPGTTEIFRNVSLLEDTVVLLRGRGLKLRPAGGESEILLPSGTRAVRIFEDRSRTYVHLASGTADGAILESGESCLFLHPEKRDWVKGVFEGAKDNEHGRIRYKDQVCSISYYAIRDLKEVDN